MRSALRPTHVWEELRNFLRNQPREEGLQVVWSERARLYGVKSKLYERRKNQEERVIRGEIFCHRDREFVFSCGTGVLRTMSSWFWDNSSDPSRPMISVWHPPLILSAVLVLSHLSPCSPHPCQPDISHGALTRASLPVPSFTNTRLSAFSCCPSLFSSSVGSTYFLSALCLLPHPWLPVFCLKCPFSPSQIISSHFTWTLSSPIFLFTYLTLRLLLFLLPIYGLAVLFFLSDHLTQPS